MIELSEAQQRALQAEQGRPVEVVDPATQQRYVLLTRQQYERIVLEGGPGQAPSTPLSSPEMSPGEGVRVRLRDLPTPPDVLAEVEHWWRKYGHRGKDRWRELEEQFKLQYYYGGQPIYVLRSPEGTVVLPIAERYRDTPGLRYVLLTVEERPRACLTIPPRWRDVTSEILT
jgi:hypothetical protein